MTGQLSPKKEYCRLRRELGKLMKSAREHERLTPGTIAEQNGFADTKELYRLEHGRCKHLWKYFQLADYYGLHFHLSMDYLDENLNKSLRREQAEDSKLWFQRMWSGILQRQRWFHHYTLEELAAKTNIPAAKIRQMEQDGSGFSLDEACRLMAYFDKSLIPEAYKLE